MCFFTQRFLRLFSYCFLHAFCWCACQPSKWTLKMYVTQAGINLNWCQGGKNSINVMATWSQITFLHFGLWLHLPQSILVIFIAGFFDLRAPCENVFGVILEYDCHSMSGCMGHLFLVYWLQTKKKKVSISSSLALPINYAFIIHIHGNNIFDQRVTRLATVIIVSIISE